MTVNRTVLIVEDALADQELYRRCLLGDANCTYAFLEAQSIRVALELCRTRSIDAILLDYQLPDGNGLQFLTSLHAQSNGSSPPIVMVTGQGDESIAVQAIKLGAEDYLVKYRLTPQQLQLSLRGAIENARLRAELQQSENRFRVSIENMLDCFGMFSAIRDEQGEILDFRIDYMNAAALTSNRMSIADLGKGLCEVLPANRETGLFADYCRVVKTGEPIVKENLLYTDVFGSQLLTRAYDIHASKLNDGFVASWRDVTARKQAEIDRQQQLERERIVNQVTQQIRRSLDLEEVLNTAVSEVRQFLGADRTFLYRFNPDFSGVIVVEAIGDRMPPALHAQVEDTYFMETRAEDYRQGRIQVVEDIQTAGLTDCHVEMLERFGIRANLVVPILQTDRLWGLLVASQSLRPRQWQAIEIQLTQQLAAQIGIAIHQAELYQQAQLELRDRSHLQAALQENQERLSLAIEGAGMATWDTDWQTGRMLWSEGHFRIFGYEPTPTGDATPEIWQHCVHPDDLDRVQQAIETARLTRSLYQPQYRIIRADTGEIRWLQTFGRFLYNEAGATIRFVGIFFDCTERKQQETALHQSEERLQIGIQVAGIAIACFNYATNTVELSPEAAAMYGLPPDQLTVTRDRIHATFHPEEQEIMAQIIQQVLNPNGDGWFARDHRVVWQNGEVRWLSVRKQVFFDRSGAIPHPGRCRIEV